MEIGCNLVSNLACKHFSLQISSRHSKSVDCTLILFLDSLYLLPKNNYLEGWRISLQNIVKMQVYNPTSSHHRGWVSCPLTLNSRYPDQKCGGENAGFDTYSFVYLTCGGSGMRDRFTEAAGSWGLIPSTRATETITGTSHWSSQFPYTVSNIARSHLSILRLLCYCCYSGYFPSVFLSCVFSFIRLEHFSDRKNYLGHMFNYVIEEVLWYLDERIRISHRKTCIQIPINQWVRPRSEARSSISLDCLFQHWIIPYRAA